MKNLEIILSDFDKNYLDLFINNELSCLPANIISSHFYEENTKKDLDFFEISSLKQALSPRGSGYVFFRKINLGFDVENVMIIFSFGEQKGDVVFNFLTEEVLLYPKNKDIVVTRIEKILTYFISHKRSFNYNKLILGFEPAEDDDCNLFITDKNEVTNLEKVKAAERLYNSL